MELLERITREAGKLGGKPCIRRMRIPVSDVLGLLAHGLTAEEVLDQLPDLEAEDIRAERAQSLSAHEWRGPAKAGHYRAAVRLKPDTTERRSG